MPDQKIPVVEMFGPTIQGEGALCGQVSYFIRTGGCAYSCSWCDSMHAVDPSSVRAARRLDQLEIVEGVRGLAPSARKRCWVTISGGDPVVWEMGKVVHGLKLMGFSVAVETQAYLWRDWLELCDLVTASPKPPSSGMVDRFRVDRLQKYAARLRERLMLKIVCFSEEDLDWAVRIRSKFPALRFFLSSGTPVDDSGRDSILKVYEGLVTSVLSRPSLHDAVVLPQVHALLWGKELGR